MFKIKLEESTVELIKQELNSIPDKYQKPFNSTHEGYAVLLEEVRELENVVFFGEKGNTEQDFKERLKAEAVQVAAMACRIIQELTGEKKQDKIFEQEKDTKKNYYKLDTRSSYFKEGKVFLKLVNNEGDFMRAIIWEDEYESYKINKDLDLFFRGGEYLHLSVLYDKFECKSFNN